MTTTFGKLFCNYEQKYIKENTLKNGEKLGMLIIGSNIVYLRGGYNENAIRKQYKNTKIKY
jgi:hypothetical protein